MSEFTQGLTLSGIGILITFSSLGILILLILGLKAIFPPQELDDLKEAPAQEPAVDRERLKETAAAVGVATLLKLKGVGRGELGSLLEKPVGNWWQKNLDRIQGKEQS